MGLDGVLVVTEPDDATGAHVAYGTKFDNAVPMLLSEIDPAQNAAVTTAASTAGFSDQLVWNGQAGQCGDPAIHTCYPPAVNYSPLYYLINGKSSTPRIAWLPRCRFRRPAPENRVCCAWSTLVCACTCPRWSAPR